MLEGNYNYAITPEMLYAIEFMFSINVNKLQRVLEDWKKNLRKNLRRIESEER